MGVLLLMFPTAFGTDYGMLSKGGFVLVIIRQYFYLEF